MAERSLESIVAEYGAAAKRKLAAAAVHGEPEDQLRNPLVRQPQCVISIGVS
jgi:hypothetical protein